MVFSHATKAAANTVSFEAHVHGLSELTIAIEKQALEIEIISPAINIVGFEHKATTPNEIAAVKSATSVLNSPANIFAFSGGSCSLIEKTIDTSSIISAKHLQNDTHEKKHLHTHQHSHEHEHEHEHEPHDKNTEVSNHSEIIAHYRYYCKKASTLRAITVKVFDQFAGVDEIHAKWLTETQQSSITLNPTHQVINLR